MTDGPVFQAWRPGAFALRVILVAAFDVVVAGAAFSAGTDPAVGSGFVLALFAVVVGVTALPTVVAITTAYARVQVDVGPEAVTLVPVDDSWLRPDLRVRLALRGLEVRRPVEEGSADLVLYGPDGEIALSTSEAGARERLERELAARGVPFRA